MCGESGEMLDFHLYFSLVLMQVIQVEDIWEYILALYYADSISLQIPRLSFSNLTVILQPP